MWDISTTAGMLHGAHWSALSNLYITISSLSYIVMNLVCFTRMPHATAPKKMRIQKWAWMRILSLLPHQVNLLDHPVVLQVFHHVLDET
jgi:hypothetical protein